MLVRSLQISIHSYKLYITPKPTHTAIAMFIYEGDITAKPGQVFCPRIKIWFCCSKFGSILRSSQSEASI